MTNLRSAEHEFGEDGGLPDVDVLGRAEQGSRMPEEIDAPISAESSWRSSGTT
jgi:hypothetical protein